MQNDETVGRVLLASLHQAIGEVLPARLEFYEGFLKPSELHKRTIGAASFMAVVSFLRREGDLYDVVTTRAGHQAATWSLEEISAVEQAFVRAVPHRLRARLALRLINRMLRGLYSETSADMTRRGNTIFVDLHGSPFCGVREPVERPQCGFYASAIATFLRALNLETAVRISRCRAVGAKSCLLMVLTDKVGVLAGAEPATVLGLATDLAVERPRPPVKPSPTPAEAAAQPASIAEAAPASAAPQVQEPLTRTQPSVDGQPNLPGNAGKEPSQEAATTAPTAPVSVADEPHEMEIPAAAPPPEVAPVEAAVASASTASATAMKTLEAEQIEERWAGIAIAASEGSHPTTRLPTSAAPRTPTDGDSDPEASWRRF